MARNIYYRDFTLAKAAALCGLMALAVFMQGNDTGGVGVAGEVQFLQEQSGTHILPVFVIKDAECDNHEKVGVSL